MPSLHHAQPIDDTHDDAALSRRYLTLIAEVAERLLAADDPAVMIDEMFALIRSELRLDVFFNYRLENGRLLLEAYGGLTPAQAEAGAVLEIGQTVCGCVARDRTRAHVTSIQMSSDPMVDFIRAIGIDAYACTPLVHGGTLMGTLGFGRRWGDRFSDDELHFLNTICHYVALAKYRLSLDQRLREGVSHREQLLAELNHRVRNALQTAISLVAVESVAADPGVREPIQRITDRLEVLALAHRPLYADARTEHVDLQTLLMNVLEQAGALDARVRGNGVQRLPIEQAVALALLVHELTAAAAARVDTLSIAEADDGALVLGFDGPGWGAMVDRAPHITMVQAFARQLRASFGRDRGDSLRITFRLHRRG